MEKELKQIELAIDAYQKGLDGNDAQEEANADTLGEDAALNAKLDRLKARQARTGGQVNATTG